MRGLYGKVRREVCAKKQKANTFPYFPEQTRLIRHLLYGFWFIFSAFSAVFVFRRCRLPYLRACWFRFMFTQVRHSFSSALIDKQLPRKATLMFQDALLFELFQRTYLVLFYFHLNQLRIFPAKTYWSLLQRPGGAIRFFPDLSATTQWACAMIWKQAQPYNKIYYFPEILRVIKIPYIRQRLWVCFANGKGFLTSFCDNTYKKYNHQYLKKYTFTLKTHCLYRQ